MPYIVCLNLPGCLPEAAPVAVASLEEARAVAKREIEDADSLDQQAMSDFSASCERLSEMGGFIGPLPDGYVVEVREVTWRELQELAGPDVTTLGLPNRNDVLIDTYNERSA